MPNNPFDSYSEKLAQDFDGALDQKDLPKTNELISEAEAELENHDIISQAKICYSIGTSYGNLKLLDSGFDHTKCCEKQLFYLQKATDLLSKSNDMTSDSTPFLGALLLQLYTNYANALEDCGRRIRALHFYHLAMGFDPSFAMARGNAGIAFFHYATLVYDNSHKHYMHYFAYHYLKYTLNNPKGVHPNAEKIFRQVYNQYGEKHRTRFEKDLQIPKFKFAKKELKYRQWALENRLFINPLNDLPIIESCFAADVLHLPNMIVKIDEKPVLPGLYNQLKQEYVFSRYMYYESLQQNSKAHFADKENYLYQFSDYPSYSIRIEKMKAAYRILYSLFDKVAFFINRYFELGIHERDVSFKRVWRIQKINGKDELRNVLNPSENFALNSLFWISKELFDSDGAFSTNPSAPRKNEIRNALEHKYVKVYGDFFPAQVNGEIDDMALYISEAEFEDITIDILKQIREVLICLSLAVHIEESKRHTEISNINYPSIGFLKYDDNWKL